MDDLCEAVNQAFTPLLAEAVTLTDDGIDVRLNDVGWAMLSLGWFAPASRPAHERIEV